MVLFQRGAVRLLDRLLEDPQQQVEDLLASDETIRSEEERVDAHWPTSSSGTVMVFLFCPAGGAPAWWPSLSRWWSSPVNR